MRGKTTFDKAFPNIASAKVVVEQSGQGVSEWNKTSTRSGNHIGEYFDCANGLCYNGGVRIGDLIRRMVGNKETHLEETLFCQGYEGSPKGRRRYRDCLNGFKVTVDIEYVESGKGG